MRTRKLKPSEIRRAIELFSDVVEEEGITLPVVLAAMKIVVRELEADGLEVVLPERTDREDLI